MDVVRSYEAQRAGSDELQVGLLRNSRAGEHGPALLWSCLQSAKRLLDMSGFHRCLSLARRIEQSLRQFPLLHARVVTGCLLEEIFVLFDLQRLLRQGLDHLEGQETEDVDYIVRRLAVGDVVETSPLAKPFPFAVRKGCLSEFRPGDVFLLGHTSGAFVGFAEALKSDKVHFLFFFVLFVFAFGDFLTKEGRWLPGQTDFGLLVLLRCVVDRTSYDRIFTGTKVRVSSFIVRVLDVLAHVFPRKEGA